MRNRRNSKLTAEKVYSMREKWAAGLATQAELAIEHQVSINTVRNALHGVTWQSVRQVESVDEIEHAAAESQRRFALYEKEGLNDEVSVHQRMLGPSDRPPEPRLTQEEYAENIKKLAAKAKQRRGLTDEKDEPSKGDSQS